LDFDIVVELESITENSLELVCFSDSTQTV